MARGECMDRLATVHVGRVGITVDALPIILPVNFVLVDERVFFRTTVGTKLEAATSRSVVAFQADAYSADGTAGWSVLIVGRSSRADQDERPAAVANEALAERWSAPRHTDHLVEIEAANVSGRRFGDVTNPWLLLH